MLNQCYFFVFVPVSTHIFNQIPLSVWLFFWNLCKQTVRMFVNSDYFFDKAILFAPFINVINHFNRLQNTIIKSNYRTYKFSEIGIIIKTDSESKKSLSASVCRKWFFIIMNTKRFFNYPCRTLWLQCGSGHIFLLIFHTHI